MQVARKTQYLVMLIQWNAKLQFDFKLYENVELNQDSVLFFLVETEITKKGQ